MFTAKYLYGFFSANSASSYTVCSVTNLESAYMSVVYRHNGKATLNLMHSNIRIFSGGFSADKYGG